LQPAPLGLAATSGGRHRLPHLARAGYPAAIVVLPAASRRCCAARLRRCRDKSAAG